MNNQITVNSIFSEYADSYISDSGNFISFEQNKIIRALTACRTGQLGYRIQKCDCCGNELISFNSCRNRHCPLCQNLKREEWLLKRKFELLPCNYFHVVFTLPHSLNTLIFLNQQELYSLFFEIAADTLKKFAANKHHLGANIGFLMILHTWGQQLSYHPHLHCLVTAGGLSNDNSKWINSKKKDFLFCVKKLSKAFSRNFCNALLERFENKKLKPLFFNDEFQKFENHADFKKFVTNLKYQKWVVYSRAPLTEDYSVIDYLGRYAYRVAIANSRIIKNENGFVHFKFKDYRDNQEKILSLKIFEFMRRFLLHSLPDGFRKIRYYGILSNNRKKKLLPLYRKLLNKEFDAAQSVFDHIAAQDKPLDTAFAFLKENSDFNKCPNCKIGKLFTTAIYLPTILGYHKIIVSRQSKNITFKNGP